MKYWGGSYSRSHPFFVRPGHIGHSMYRRDGLHFCSERVVDYLQGSLLEVNVSEVIVHEGDEPYAVVDFPYADMLTREHGGDVDFFRCMQIRPKAVIGTSRS